jgi:hypothetical protein
MANANDSKICFVLAIWYSSLLLSITSIGSATQQIVALNRLASNPNGLEMIRWLLAKDQPDIEAGRQVLRPRGSQLWLWQLPLSLLNASLYSFVARLCVLVYSRAPTGAKRWSSNDIKVGVVLPMESHSQCLIHPSAHHDLLVHCRLLAFELSGCVGWTIS